MPAKLETSQEERFKDLACGKPGEAGRIGGPPCGIAADVVHVWRIRVEDWRGRESLLEGLLDETAAGRAARFHAASDRFRHVVAHGVLRLILAHGYHRVAPEAIVFGKGANGKPRVVEPAFDPPVHFNLAHSAGVVLVAVAASEVGVDAEYVRENGRWPEVAGFAFSSREQEQLADAEPERRTEYFFHGWTRKEAYLKACGDGLCFPLTAFTVSLAPEDARLLDVNGNPAEAGRWAMCGIDAGAGYCAAVVLKAAACRCRLFDATPARFEL